METERCASNSGTRVRPLQYWYEDSDEVDQVPQNKTTVHSGVGKKFQVLGAKFVVTKIRNFLSFWVDLAGMY